MDLVKRLFACCALTASIAFGQSLSLTIGNSVAGQNYATKGALFVFRVNGCSDALKAQVTVTAEDMNGGMRHSNPLSPVVSPEQPGVYAVSDRAPVDFNRVVAITATCQNETAGAIVPVIARSLVREGAQLLPHAPTQAEIEAALKSAVATPPSVH